MHDPDLYVSPYCSMLYFTGLMNAQQVHLVRPPSRLFVSKNDADAAIMTGKCETVTDTLWYAQCLLDMSCGNVLISL